MSHVQYQYTDYFKRTQNRPDRKYIKKSWITETLEQPQGVKMQDNSRVSYWRYINSQRKVLRVITLNDRRTIHNAYYDRDALARLLKG